jgi:hypothetical protein
MHGEGPPGCGSIKGVKHPMNSCSQTCAVLAEKLLAAPVHTQK